jgi:hypothetical protein
MRKPSVKPRTMHVYHGIYERGDSPDVIFHSGNGVPRCDRALLYCIFAGRRYTWDGKPEKSFVEELEARGYDISTIRFSIRKKDAA